MDTYWQTADRTPQVLIDEASATVTYVGYSHTGNATSAGKWLIKKVSVSGNVTTTQWASEEANQIWDNRASLSYS